MSSIDPSGKLLGYLRQQAAALRDARPSVAAELSSTQLGTPKEQDTRIALASQLASINRDHPHARRKAFRLFLTSTMAREFGDAVTADPKFGELVDRVQTTMEADAELLKAIELAGASLLSSAHKEHGS
jgi:hypothetical protein